MAVNFGGSSASRVGGWALSKQTCPEDSTLCGQSWCCPNSLVCSRLQDQNIANVCCPSAKSCYSAFTEVGLCADTTWTLWNSTTTKFDGGYFCCEPGQIGLETGNCIAPDAYIPTNPSAVLIAPGATQTAPPTSTSTCDCPTSSPTSTGTQNVCPSLSPSNADTPDVCPGQDTGPIIAAGVLGGVTLILICVLLYLSRRLYLLGNARTASESPHQASQPPHQASQPPHQASGPPQWTQWPQWSPQSQSEGAESDMRHVPALIPQMHGDSKFPHQPPAHGVGVMELDTGFRNELES